MRRLAIRDHQIRRGVRGTRRPAMHGNHCKERSDWIVNPLIDRQRGLGSNECGLEPTKAGGGSLISSDYPQRPLLKDAAELPGPFQAMLSLPAVPTS